MSFLWYNYSDDNYTNSIEGLVIEKYYMDYIEKPINELLEIARKEVFDFEYPFYTEDGEQKTKFEKMFILMYYQRGFANETVGSFKLNLLSRLTQYMPYYEELYKSMLYKIDPLINRKYTIKKEGTEQNLSDYGENQTKNINENRKYNDNKENTTVNDESITGDENTTTNSTDNKTTEDQTIESENPQINFSGKDFANKMNRSKQENNENYNGSSNRDFSNTANSTIKENGNNDGTSENKTESRNEINGNKNDNKTINNNESMEGFVGDSQAEAIEKYRKIIVNINEDLCRNLEILFSIFQ